MSIVLNHSSASTNAADNRAWYASMLARYAQTRRAELELTAERAAEMSGMELSEWLAVEAGWLPEDRNMLRSIAATLGVYWTDLEILVLFARCAQEAA